MIALIAALTMLVAFVAPLIGIYTLGVWVGKRGGTAIVARTLFHQGRVLNERRRQVTGGKHRDSQLQTLASFDVR